MAFDQVVFSEGRCVASAQAVTVLIDEATRKPTPLTGELKVKLSPASLRSTARRFAPRWPS